MHLILLSWHFVRLNTCLAHQLATIFKLYTAGQFVVLKDKQGTFSLMVLDEAHKIFDCVPSFHPAFDDLRKLQGIDCRLLAMSATLTNQQIEILKTKFLCSEKCISFIQGVHRDNLKYHIKKYQYMRQKKIYEHCNGSSSDNDDNCDDSVETLTSPWYSVVSLTGD